MDQEYIKLGIIKRVQGLKGQVLALLTESIGKLEEIHTLFIELDHTLVPYSVEQYQLLHDRAIIKFQGINNRTIAYSLKGKTLFIRPADLAEQVITQEPTLILVGYQVSDRHQGTLGIVERIERLPLQKLLVVNYLAKELLIPYHEKLIYHIDHGNKQIVVDLPTGFIEALI